MPEGEAKPKEEEDKKPVEKKPSEEPKKVEPAQPKKVEKPQEAPKPKSEVVQEMEKISTYNGDATEKYNWSQSVFDVQVQIPLPEGTKANQLDVKI